VDDVDPRVSKLTLAHALASAGLNLASSTRTRGLRRTGVFFALGTGLPAAGELLVTGRLGLLRHRTRPRVKGVPVAILLDWYSVIHGSYTAAERVLARLPVSEASRRKALPTVAALVATSLDLVLDPAGLEAGLWEWNADGAYAADVAGANGRRGVPPINYLGWLTLVAEVAFVYGRVAGDEDPGGDRLPVFLLLPFYLAAAMWSVKSRRPGYLLRSALFPAALYAGVKRG
jgi:uncharacterized membrane protein